jgi:hypothetical protein
LAVTENHIVLEKTFWTLLSEGHFTFEILASGVTQLGKVNYAKKGIYFTSFISLTTGLERIGKLCLILDFCIKNEGTFPDEYFLKKEIGHDLEKLYKKSQEIIVKQNFKLSHLQVLDNQIHKDILSILSRFARGDRYSNINYLVKSNSQSDPIKEWNLKVDQVIFENRISQKKKDEIAINAKLAGQLLGGYSMVRFRSETEEELNDIEKSSFATGVTQAVSKYRQLYVLHIIRYWVDFLRVLQNKAHRQNIEIPHFSEIFAIFNNNDSYFLTRKTFEKL